MPNLSASLIETIKKCPYFCLLPPEKLSEVTQHIEQMEMKEGELLFAQGDQPDYLYILIQGKLASILTDAAGKTIVVGTVNSMETVGELGAISGEPRSLSVEAVVDSVLVKMPSSEFKQLCYDYPVILTEISQLIVNRSFKSIKLIAYERTVQDISVIVPVSERINNQWLKEKLEKNLENHNVMFVSSLNMTSDKILEIIKEAEDKKKRLVILIEEWQQDFLRLCREKFIHLFLVSEESELHYFSKTIEKMRDVYKKILSVRTELILFHPDKTQEVTGTLPWLKAANVALHHHARMNDEVHWQRLARFMAGTANVLVLGGGASKGLAHLGAIKALLENGLPIDAIGGTSIGGAFGAGYAKVQTLDRTAEICERLKISSFAAVSWKNLTWPLISIFSSNPAAQTVMDIFEERLIEDLWIPFFAISANLSTQDQHIHRTGLLWEAVRTTTSIPGMFPPVLIDGQLHVDGGVLNNLPVDIMRNMVGPSHIIFAVTLAKQGIQQNHYQFPPILPLRQTLLHKLRLAYRDYVFPSLFGTLIEALLIGSSANENKNAQAADILIEPDLSKFKLVTKGKENEEEMKRLGYQETLLALKRAEQGEFVIKDKIMTRIKR